MVKSSKLIISIVLMTALICVAVISATPAVSYAEAEVAGTYGGTDASSLWYYGADYLNLSAAKEIVSSWDNTVLRTISPVYIAVIDTGITTQHEIFSDTLATNSSGTVLGYNAYASRTGGDTTNISDTVNYHGTGVAGVIAMLIKEFGLQDYIKIYPIKANTASNDSFSVESVVAALNWAVKDGINVDVINMSFGTLKADNPDWSTNPSLKEAIINAAASAVVVSAAGNNSKDSASDSKNVFYPAGLDGVVSVMGYGKNGKVYSTSNYGSAYDIIAPGEEIYTASNYVKETKISRYENIKGTSVAAPMVSFGAALLKLRLLYEGQLRNTLNGNKIARMITNLNGNKVSKDTYSFTAIDYNTLLTQDFSSSSYDYLNPTDIYLTYPTENFDTEHMAFYMVADSIKEIKFTAVIQPYGKTNPDLDDVVEWYVMDNRSGEKLIGRGLNLTYAPEKGGQYKIVAKFKYDQVTYSDEIAWNIDFLPFFASEARVTLLDYQDSDVTVAPNAGITYTGDETVLSLTGIRYCDTSTGIKWFVNGEYAGDGETFKFSTKKTGVYNISCEFEGTKIENGYSFVLTVKSAAEKPLNIALISVGCVAALLIVALLAAYFVKESKKKNILRKNLMNEEYK